MGDKSAYFAGLLPDGAKAILDGWMAQGAHYYPMLVQFEDTDAGGIVYHANYLSFAERGRSGWLRLIGISQAAELHDNQVGFVVRAASLRYLRPAKLGDEILVETKVKDIGKARIVADQTIRRAEKQQNEQDGHIFAKVEVEIVMVNGAGRPIRFAPTLLEKMQSSIKN